MDETTLPSGWPDKLSDVGPVGGPHRYSTCDHATGRSYAARPGSPPSTLTRDLYEVQRLPSEAAEFIHVSFRTAGADEHIPVGGTVPRTPLEDGVRRTIEHFQHPEAT